MISPHGVGMQGAQHIVIRGRCLYKYNKIYRNVVAPSMGRQLSC